MPPSITICIITHNRPDLLQRLLHHLALCRLPASFAGTVVVENGKTTKSKDICQAAQAELVVNWLSCDSPIKSAALNLALEKISSGLVLFIDDDATPNENWIAAYERAASSYPSKHYFGGPTAPRYEVRPPEWISRWLPDSARGFSLQMDADNSSSTNFLGFNWAAYVDDLREIGGFSTDFGPGTARLGGDETFAQWQLQRSGIRAVYVSEAKVLHDVPQKSCSPEWLLRRVRASAINHGILYEHWCRHRNEQMQPLYTILKWIVQRSELRDLWNLLQMKIAGRFWLQICAARVPGFFRGISEGGTDRPLDADSWRTNGLKSSPLQTKPTGFNTPGHLATVAEERE